MEKIRILVSTATGLHKMEGIATILHDYFERFDSKRFEIDIIASGVVAPESRAAFEQAGVGLIPAPARKKNTREYLKFLKNKVKDYDIFYLNGSSAMLALDLMAAKAGGVPVRAVESHNTRTAHAFLDKLLRPVFYRSYTDALACGQEAGKWLFEDRPFKILKNGRSPKTYAFNPEIRSKMRKELGLGENILVFGHIGNLNPEKNQTFLIDAFAKIHEQNPDSHLFLIGAGALEQDYRQQAKDLGIEDAVTLTGKITNVPEYLQAMDVMALPSLFEGLPLVAVEWQMNGLPVLVSDTVTRECAFSDLMEFKSLADGTESWAEKLLEMAQNKKDRQKASEEGCAKAIEAGFDIDESAKDLQEDFAAMLKRVKAK